MRGRGTRALERKLSQDDFSGKKRAMREADQDRVPAAGEANGVDGSGGGGDRAARRIRSSKVTKLA